MVITIKRIINGYEIKDRIGNYMLYFGFTKREALKRFKAFYGYKYKRNITVYDFA